jgi:hypothetical protein
MKLMLLLLLLGSQAGASDNIELLAGGITYHVMDKGAAKYNENKLSDDGRAIANPISGIGFSTYTKTTFTNYQFFNGENSIGHSIRGALYETGARERGGEAGIVLGGYTQSNRAFTSRNLESFRLTNIQDTDIVPIFGVALNYRIMLGKRTFMRINNIIGPVITNHSLSLGVSL